MEITKIDKVVRLGTIQQGRRWASIYCKIEYKDGKLSISGVIGPLPSGNALGGCGQIDMEFKENDSRGYYTFADIKKAPNWDNGKIAKFFQIWKVWHLKDVPQDILEFLAYLPDTDIIPAWV